MTETNRLFMGRETINQEFPDSTVEQKAYAEERANMVLWEMNYHHFGNGILPERYHGIWLQTYRTSLMNIIDTCSTV